MGLLPGRRDRQPKPHRQGEPDAESQAPVARDSDTRAARELPGGTGAPAMTGDGVPAGVVTAAGWSWRLIVIGAFVYALFKVLSGISEVSVPVAVALMITAAMWPLAGWLNRKGIHRGIASVLCLLLLVVLVGGVFTLVGAQIAGQWRELADQSVASFRQVMRWLADSPLHVDSTQVNAAISKAETWASSSQGRIASWAAAAGTGVGRFMAGLIMALFATFFFIYEGQTITERVSVVIPARSRPRVLDASQRGWVALVSYVRAAVIVAFVDGLGAGIGAAVIGSSMAVAIGALTFVLAFVPIAGAFVAGVIAVAVVLVTLGFVKAVIMLVVFVAVMQIESHVLQPFLLGKAVSIHPLAVLVGIAIGAIISGVVGALFAIPLVAFGIAFVKAWAAQGSPEVQHDGGAAEPAQS